MSNEMIARRYASALADVATAGGNSKEVAAEVHAFAAMVRSSDELRKAFVSPAIGHGSKEKLLDELIARSKPSKTTANFLRVLLRNGRLGDLAEIDGRFAAELEERGGIVAAEVVSARELDTDERSLFENDLNRLTGKKVRVEFKVDSGLIGGAVTRVGSTVFDGSVRTKLDNLREQLMNG